VAARAWPGGALLAVMAAGIVALGMAAPARAQPRAGTAELKAVTGQVEIQSKGETQWRPATVGARLAEGDGIRAHAGASAVLDLPDGSTIFVAENSRMVVSKLEFDPQTQSRQAFLHLVVGKVRAVVSQAAVTLVRARQSNFTITTPTAVAAARGTVFEVLFDALQSLMRVAVLPIDAQRTTGLVSCYSLSERYSSVLIREGLAATAQGTAGCGAPVPIASLPDAGLIGTLRNPRVPGAAFSAPVIVPAVPDPGGAAPVVFTSDPADTLSPAPPSTIGIDIGLPPPQQAPTSPVNP
jgi:hypothetical protein